MNTRARLLVPVVALGASAALLAGCAGSGSTGSSAQVGPSGQLSVTPNVQTSQSAGVVGDPYQLIPTLVEQVQPSIVSIQVQTGQGGAQGSGVVWNGGEGVIVTNNHVVEGATAVQVVLSDGDTLDGEVLATDPATDLAVVKVTGGNLPSATFAKDLPRVGELAIAMGNPLGFENTVTAGIVSALHRSLGDATYVDLIQTDAPISPGNSGGALVNDKGEVIGINSAGIPSTENANSLGFAIPSTTVISVVDQLLQNGVAKHAFLGVSSSDTADGVVIESVTSGSAAEAAGFQQGDVIVAADGQTVSETADLVSVLRSKVPGDTIVITVERGGEQVELTATLGERPDEQA
jgi:S1-C subfamily serine protease